MKAIFKQYIENTQRYLDYIERHYDNVQKAFKEFKRRTLHKNFVKKYDKFIYETKIYDDYNWICLETIIKNHDLSKLSHEEFIPYRDNFYSLDEKTKQENKEKFENAWEHHKSNNIHHWQSRVDKKFTEIQGFIGVYYAIENVMDWIAMSYEFNEKPLNKYYLENKDKITLSDDDKYIIETVYKIMMDKDLE